MKQLEIVFRNMWSLLAILFLVAFDGISQDKFVKTGYFTHLYAREYETDMPREFFFLVEEDGTMTALWFTEHRTRGQYSIWNFNPYDYLGQTVSVDFDVSVDNQNNEFTFFENDQLVLIPRLRVIIINSFTTSSQGIPAPEDYRYPQTDTLLIPHDILIDKEVYEEKTPTAVVDLSDYVQGEGTNASPFVSSDGTAGLKEAITALPGGGTIEIPTGIYRATTGNLAIPRFVALKGVGASKPTIILANQYMWKLKGSNTIDNITVDFTQIDRRYSHEVIGIDHNSRNVNITNSKFIGNYKVDPNTGEELEGLVVMFRMYSNLENITFEKDTFLLPLRSIAVKGQKNLKNITIRETLFKDQCMMCITFDQVANTSNIVIEDNEFIEFSHFGVAFARINDFTIRNNTFYSRNLESLNTYNQAIHIEEHCQNALIEDNIIDVTLKTPGTGDPTSTTRSFGIILHDSRRITIRNNEIRHSHVHFSAGLANKTPGYSEVSNNIIEDGAILIKDSHEDVTVKNNEFINPPEYAIELLSSKPMLHPFGGHVITSNTFKEMDGKQPFYIRGEVKNVTISDNDFLGCDQVASHLDLYASSENLEISGNKFAGIEKSKAFDLEKSLPAGNSLSVYEADNFFTTECNF